MRPLVTMDQLWRLAILLVLRLTERILDRSR
jgi:hypothetical protein